jgi:hypothetical protein
LLHHRHSTNPSTFCVLLHHRHSTNPSTICVLLHHRHSTNPSRFAFCCIIVIRLILRGLRFAASSSFDVIRRVSLLRKLLPNHQNLYDELLATVFVTPLAVTLYYNGHFRRPSFLSLRSVRDNFILGMVHSVTPACLRLHIENRFTHTTIFSWNIASLSFSWNILYSFSLF